MSWQEIDLIRVARQLVRVHLGVRAGEQVLVVADPQTDMRMAMALAGAVAAEGAEYTIAVMPTRDQRNGTRLTAVIDRGLEAADVLIGLTKSSGAPTYSETVARLLRERRLRSLSMVMRSVDNWTKGAATADYEALDALGRRVAARWAQAERLEVRSACGTDLRARVSKEPVMGQVVIVECGIAREPGVEAAFSDGEVSQRPSPGSAEGTLIVDGPIAMLGPGGPIRVEVRGGKVVSVQPVDPTGTARSARLNRLLESVPGLDHVAEIGLGLNPAALRNDDFEEEKKAEGNVHVALGDDVFYGGTHRCSLHLDMVIRDVTFLLDGEPLVVEGRLREAALSSPGAGKGGAA